MAAGLGFKTFTTGEVLTAGDVNGYLMQGINVFTNSTARDAAITAPAEGQFAFTKDNNSLWYYDGAAWVASGATGDIEGVTAGVGISGGGTSGTVTVTNSMATAIDAKGDLVPGTGADTFARLAVGANDTVLTADSSTATGLKWATVAGGGITLLSTTTLTGSSVTVSSISGSYLNLFITIEDLGTGGAVGICRMTVNSVTSYLAVGVDSGTSAIFQSSANIPLSGNRGMKDTGGDYKAAVVNIYNYSGTNGYKAFDVVSGCTNTGGGDAVTQAGGNIFTEAAITSVTVSMSAGSFDGNPTMKIYGVK
jgi:hypothetical protein